MRKLLWALPILISGTAHAANFPISAGASTATIQSTINSAAAASGGNTVTFAAGNYTITSQINIPCPASALTITGPTPTGAPTNLSAGTGATWPISPTAVISGNLGVQWGFTTSGSCSTALTIQYLEWNGGSPSGGGGGFMLVPQNTNNLTVWWNFLHGNGASQFALHEQDSLIWMDGPQGQSPRDANVTIKWNRFGQINSNDCAALMNVQGGTTPSDKPNGPSCVPDPGHCSTGGYVKGPDGHGTCWYQACDTEKNTGGYCAAVGVHVNTDNFTFSNNMVSHQEQGLKFFEGTQSAPGIYTPTNITVQNNDFVQIHRIVLEAQQGSPGPWNIANNDEHDMALFGGVSWGLSLPQGGPNNALSNVLALNNPNSAVDKYGFGTAGATGIEYWGNGGAVNNNLMQGYWSGGVGWGFGDTTRQIRNNTFQFIGSTQYIFQEESQANVPQQSGNVTGGSPTTVTSIAPTISPSSGSAPLTVTLNDTGYTSGSVPQGNTGSWYTTDGSTPVPGTNGKYLPNGGTFTMASAGTVKAVGMWGAANQPSAYPSGYGFVPSSAVSATFSGASSGLFISPTGNDANPGTSASPWLTPNHAMTCGQTITALPGTYASANFQSGKWGTVTCAAGNNVAWLTCQTFDACKISSTTTDAMWVDKSFWGVQGWEASTTVTQFGACFRANPSTNGTIVHHVIFANDVANGCRGGGLAAYSFGGNSTTGSVDYIAFLGNAVYNAASGNGECYSGINVFEPIALDTAAGTHIYVAGNFSWANIDGSPCGGVSGTTDGEGINFDTFDLSQATGGSGGAFAYKQQGVIYNNIEVGNGGRGIEVELNSLGTSAAPIFIKNNTMVGSGVDPNIAFPSGLAELGIFSAFNVNSSNNLVYTAHQFTTGTNPYFALGMTNGNATDATAGNFAAGIAGNNTYLQTSPGFAYGTNTLGTNPAFPSTTTPGAPACSGTANVPACVSMLITNLKPTASGSASFGYQTPSNTSVTDALYPAWLCSVSLPSGLVTPGCGGSSPTAATPVLSPTTSSFFVSTSVAISSTTPSSTIFYTVDGSTPTTGSLVYTGAIPVSSTTTVQAIAAASGFLNSAVGSGTYTLAIPPLTGCNQSNTGSVNSMAIGGKTQQIAICQYAASGENLACSPTADKYGDVATVWGAGGAAITVGAIGNPAGCTGGLNGPGCVTGISATGGTPVNSTLTVGAHGCSAWGWTITNSPPTLLSATVTLQGGGTAVNVGSTVQACANMFYTGSITTQLCTSGTDSFGTVVSNFTSSDLTKATMNSTSGMLTGVAAGTTNAGVTAGSFTPSLAVSVNTPITGVNATFSGAQLSGAQIQ